MNTLTGKHALVTGGSRGIGLACARALLLRGAHVTLAGRDAATLAAAMQELRPLGEVCLLYTSPSPRDLSTSRMPSSA